MIHTLRIDRKRHFPQARPAKAECASDNLGNFDVVLSAWLQARSPAPHPGGDVLLFVAGSVGIECTAVQSPGG